MKKFNFQVLLVEDEFICQRILELHLAELGGIVDVVSTASEAITAISKKSYDIIFMDIGLPDKNGIEATSEIRSDFGLMVPIVGVTSHVFDKSKQTYMEAGMQEILYKPVFPEVLQNVLSEYLVEEKAVLHSL